MFTSIFWASLYYGDCLGAGLLPTQGAHLDGKKCCLASLISWLCGGGVDDGRVTYYKIEITTFLEQIALVPSDLLQILKKAIDLETVV